MTMAMRVRAKVEQLLKLEDGAQMVIITPNPNRGKKTVRTIELVLSRSPGNGLEVEAMTATIPGQTETMVQTSWAIPENWSKPRWKSVFPAKKKSVKRMMFEWIVGFIASFFRSQLR